MIIGQLRFFPSRIAPNPKEVEYWVDLTEDPYGGAVKYWNGVEWIRWDKPATDVMKAVHSLGKKLVNDFDAVTREDGIDIYASTLVREFGENEPFEKGENILISINDATLEHNGFMSKLDKIDFDKIYEVNVTTSFNIATSSIIEKGVDANTLVRWDIKFYNEPALPDLLILWKNGKKQTEDITITHWEGNINDTTLFILDIWIRGNKKRLVLTVNAYYPMYFGGSSKSELEGTDIFQLNKQPIKSNANGSYSFNIREGEYAWLCVPEGFRINKVTSSGFDVPMENFINVTTEDKGVYKCYRSSSTFKEGMFNCVIS